MLLLRIINSIKKTTKCGMMLLCTRACEGNFTNTMIATTITYNSPFPFKFHLRS